MTDALCGVLVADKAAGVTSFAWVARLKRLVRPLKVGHAGTLDPAATGVLPILIGEATKLMPYLVDHDKEYVATVRLGITTDTLDLTGRVETERPLPALGQEQVEAVCARFVGQIPQVPPMFSAAHHAGRRLYELARAGIEVERPPRVVTIRSIVVESLELPRFTIRVVCGRGTYIRALAADLGEALGVGGALERLIRTRVGPFLLAEAVAWNALDDQELDAVAIRLRPVDAGLDRYPAIRLDVAGTRAVRHGQRVWAGAGDDLGQPVRLYGADDAFLGVGRVLAAGWIKPERLLRADLPGPAVLPV